MGRIEKVWPVVPLGEVLEPACRSEAIDPQATYNILGAHWYARGLYTKDTLTGAEIRADKLYRVRKGDFVYNRLFAWKGSFAVATKDDHACYVSSEFPCFTIKQDRLDSQYLWRYFSQESVWAKALDLSEGGTPTSRNRLKEERLLEMTIPLPPLTEQRRIVARIEELTAKIQQARSLRQETVDEAEDLLDSVIEATFTKIESVERKPLAALTSKIGSGSTPMGGRAFYPSYGVTFIRSMNVRMRQFQWDNIVFIDKATHEAMNGTQVRPNDVLLNITGASIGRVACAPTDLVEANVNQHVAIIRPLEALDPRYLMYWISQPAVQEFINKEQKGATRQGFTKEQIGAFEIPVLPLAEQRNVVNFLDTLQAKVNSLKDLQTQTIVELGALQPSILDKAFKGEL
jgi:type I restriction enzyme S subunit